MIHSTEGFSCTRSDYTITLVFQPPKVPSQFLPEQESVAVTMPIVVAKQLAMVLRRQVKIHEEGYGLLPIPAESLKGMGVALEDW